MLGLDVPGWLWWGFGAVWSGVVFWLGMYWAGSLSRRGRRLESCLGGALVFALPYVLAARDLASVGAAVWLWGFVLAAAGHLVALDWLERRPHAAGSAAR